MGTLQSSWERRYSSLKCQHTFISAMPCVIQERKMAVNGQEQLYRVLGPLCHLCPLLSTGRIQHLVQTKIPCISLSFKTFAAHNAERADCPMRFLHLGNV